MPDEGLFFYEPFSSFYTRGFKVGRILYEGKTGFQHVLCLQNAMFGKVLFLDGKIQSAQIDERIYHEALVHPAMMTHPKPQKVLVIGGGEGATVREVLKHGTVGEAVMVDIDEELVRICKKHLPEWSGGSLEDSRTRLLFMDAHEFITGTAEKFDVVISDLTEPLAEGPAALLFSMEFFTRILDILKDDGVFVVQAGGADPCSMGFFCSCAKTVQRVFPRASPYTAFVFSFGLPWGFVLGSKKGDPSELSEARIGKRCQDRDFSDDFMFYSPAVHRALFSLPPYLCKEMGRARLITERNPYLWKL